jgi:transcription antitermination factor NusG
MPILTKEPDLYPSDLLDRDDWPADSDACWWAIYTRSRREKDLMRRLIQLEIPFYSPVIARRTKSPQGRVRTSHVPLFQNYVFLYGDNEVRYEAMTTNCVSRQIRVADGIRLTHDLRELRRLIAVGAPVTLEARLEPGMPVRVRKGLFAGHEGLVLRRRGTTRLVVAVNFLQQGASVELEDFELERL